MVRGRKPNLVACIHCRQAKRACDGHQTFPSPCSRCHEAGKVCSVDPAYRREKKRERLTQVEKELQRVQRSLGACKGSAQQPTPGVNDGSPISATVQSSRHHLEPPPSLPAAEMQSVDFSPQLGANTIQGVEVGPARVQALLNDFFTEYHPSCPILPDQSKFLDYSRPCPLLFWTVLVTALRGKVEDRALYSTIAGAVRKMAMDAIQPALASLQAMQALLLLCQWPLPFPRFQDPSNSFIALATNFGLRMGMHRPRHAGEFVTESSFDAEMEALRRRTWAVCFITNLSVYAALGLPATVQLDQGLLELMVAQPAWLPTTLYHQLHLSRHAFNILSSLGSCESSSTGLLPAAMPIIRTFDTELRALECQFSSGWSTLEHLIFLGTRMILCTFALASDPDNDNHTSTSTNTNDGDDPGSNPRPVPGSRFSKSMKLELFSHWLIQAYVTATTIVQTASAVQAQLFCAPAGVQRMLANAVCFLLLLKSSPHHTLVEHDTLRDHISQGCHTLQGLSIIPGDFMSRGCWLFEHFSKALETDRHERQEPGDTRQHHVFLPIRSRMGANIILSAVLRARECLATPPEPATATAPAPAPDPPAMVLDGEQAPEPDILNSWDDNAESFGHVNWDELFSEMAGYPSF